MAQVTLQIGGRSFSVTCQDGEEDHIKKLAGLLDEKARGAGDPAGLTESRMLLFTSLLLADELHNAKKGGEAPKPDSVEPQASTVADENAIAALEKLADRVEAFADSLEQSA